MQQVSLLLFIGVLSEIDFDTVLKFGNGFLDFISHALAKGVFNISFENITSTRK